MTLEAAMPGIQARKDLREFGMSAYKDEADLIRALKLAYGEGPTLDRMLLQYRQSQIKRPSED